MVTLRTVAKWWGWLRRTFRRRGLYQKTVGWGWYGDYGDMLAKSEPDAISIALPNELHCKAAIDCMKRGVDVLV